MKIGVLNPFDFWWKDPNAATRMEAMKMENERLRQCHLFCTNSIIIKDSWGNIIKELHERDFGYNLKDEIGKI